ncbi:hypothetical protein HOE425_332207 [Hoeflea sp. EC-HK425]|nr:hypothetical protein HOE425_332207 [Hoeflea sp. EC-HK425]
MRKNPTSNSALIDPHLPNFI